MPDPTAELDIADFAHWVRHEFAGFTTDDQYAADGGESLLNHEEIAQFTAVKVALAEPEQASVSSAQPVTMIRARPAMFSIPSGQQGAVLQARSTTITRPKPVAVQMVSGHTSR